jgi:hypothetical protein
LANATALGFREVAATLAGLDLSSGNRSASRTPAGKELLFVRGLGIDSSGGAQSWIFAIRENNKDYLVTYDRRGQTIAAWNGAASSRDMATDSIITPDQLVRKNAAAIFDSPAVSRDLVLMNESYTITLTGPTGTRALVFDARTGGMTGSHG